MVMCTVHDVQVETLNLASNDITHLEQFVSKATFPDSLRALSLENNFISAIQELEHLKKLNLKEIIMRGNPIQAKQDSVTYKR